MAERQRPEVDGLSSFPNFIPPDSPLSLQGPLGHSSIKGLGLDSRLANQSLEWLASKESQRDRIQHFVCFSTCLSIEFVFARQPGPYVRRALSRQNPFVICARPAWGFDHRSLACFAPCWLAGSCSPRHVARILAITWADQPGTHLSEELVPAPSRSRARRGRSRAGSALAAQRARRHRRRRCRHRRWASGRQRPFPPGGVLAGADPCIPGRPHGGAMPSSPATWANPARCGPWPRPAGANTDRPGHSLPPRHRQRRLPAWATAGA